MGGKGHIAPHRAAAACLVKGDDYMMWNHIGTGMRIAAGFSVYGTAPRGSLLTKGGLVAGQALILTKPIGTGMVLAANMRGAAKGRWVMEALQSMEQSNGEICMSVSCIACKGWAKLCCVQLVVLRCTHRPASCGRDVLC